MKITLTNKDIWTYALKHICSKGFSITDHIPVEDTGVELIGFRTASMSFGKSPYACAHEWPIDCGIQCGDDGMVITGKSPTLDEALTDGDAALKVLTGKAESYRTAFFEAFPSNPSTFIRGEGKTTGEAETKCWEKYQKILACKSHEYERRGREDGYCYCKHCGLSGLFLKPLHPCEGCGAVEYRLWSTDKNGKGYCETCFKKLPEDMMNETSRRLRKSLSEI